MAPKIRVEDGDGLTRAAADLLIRRISDVIQRQGRARVGLSGGSTPGPILRILARELPAALYTRLLVTWVDERHLPVAPSPVAWRGYPDDSNLRLAYEAWLGASPAPALVLAMSTGAALQADVARFRARFEADFDGALDVALLGAGPDGHVASLFPGHSALEAAGVCVGITDSPKPPSERLSLTLPVLSATRAIVLVAKGAAKAPALARALDGDRTLPLSRICAQGDYDWILDAGAASAL